MVQFTTIPASELPFVFLVLGAWIAISDDSRAALPMAILGGLLLAGASFIRPTALILLPVLVFPEAFRRREVVRPCVKVLIAGLVILICISPWARRNERVLGKSVLISTNGGSKPLDGQPSRNQGAPSEPTQSVRHAPRGRA